MKKGNPKEGSLESIPGVGKSIAADLRNIGIKRVSCLKGENPEKLYAKSNKFEGKVQDRCLLYVFRCAVYFAEHKKHDPKKLKWWNWMDKK
jgi:hypothetical protein